MIGYEYYKQHERTWLMTIMAATNCNLDEAFCVLGKHLEESYTITSNTTSRWNDVIKSLEIATTASEVLLDEARRL